MKTPVLTILLGLLLHSAAQALIVPFTENFAGGTANWGLNNVNNAPNWFAAGGPGGGAYISAPFDFSNPPPGFGSTTIIFRGQENAPGGEASNGAFIGDWLVGGVEAFGFMVRHNAPIPIEFNVRFAPEANTPGAISNNFSVAPGAWTLVSFPLELDSFQSFSGPPTNFDVTFSDMARIQISIERPAELNDDPNIYAFDLSNVSIIPEPGTGLLVAAALGVAGLRRVLAVRRRKRRKS